MCLMRFNSAALDVTSTVLPVVPNFNVPIFISFICEFESVTIAFDADNVPSVTPIILSASVDVNARAAN